MHIYEKWYAIEPLKGYVLKADLAVIETALKLKIDANVNFIKKRGFILVIISSRKPLIMNKRTIFHLLKYFVFKKAYAIKSLGNEKGLTGVDDIGLTIGLPY